jgi:hypothetical protein
MGRTWIYVLIGVTPWVAAWGLYMIRSLLRRPKTPGSEPVDPVAQAAGHQKWLDRSLRERIEAEGLAEGACIRAEEAAATAVSGGVAGIRRAADIAAKEAETAAAAATAADIMARRLPEGRSEKAEAFAARAAQAAATAQAAVDALAEAQSVGASDGSPAI